MMLYVSLALIASVFKNGESLVDEESVRGMVFAFNGDENVGASFAVRSGCITGTAPFDVGSDDGPTKFALKDFLVGEDGVVCDNSDDPVLSYEMVVGGLDAPKGELICDGAGEAMNCLTVRDNTTLCGLSNAGRFETVSSTECAVIKVAGAELKDVARRIVENGVAGGATNQDLLLSASVRFSSGVRNIPQPDQKRRVTPVGSPFIGAVSTMCFLVVVNLIAILILKLEMKRLPFHVPTLPTKW